MLAFYVLDKIVRLIYLAIGNLLTSFPAFSGLLLVSFMGDALDLGQNSMVNLASNIEFCPQIRVLSLT